MEKSADVFVTVRNGDRNFYKMSMRLLRHVPADGGRPSREMACFLSRLAAWRPDGAADRCAFAVLVFYARRALGDSSIAVQYADTLINEFMSTVRNPTMFDLSVGAPALRAALTRAVEMAPSHPKLRDIFLAASDCWGDDPFGGLAPLRDGIPNVAIVQQMALVDGDGRAACALGMLCLAAEAAARFSAAPVRVAITIADIFLAAREPGTPLPPEEAVETPPAATRYDRAEGVAAAWGAFRTIVALVQTVRSRKAPPPRVDGRARNLLVLLSGVPDDGDPFEDPCVTEKLKRAERLLAHCPRGGSPSTVGALIAEYVRRLPTWCERSAVDWPRRPMRTASEDAVRSDVVWPWVAFMHRGGTKRVSHAGGDEAIVAFAGFAGWLLVGEGARSSRSFLAPRIPKNLGVLTSAVELARASDRLVADCVVDDALKTPTTRIACDTFDALKNINAPRPLAWEALVTIETSTSASCALEGSEASFASLSHERTTLASALSERRVSCADAVAKFERAVRIVRSLKTLLSTGVVVDREGAGEDRLAAALARPDGGTATVMYVSLFVIRTWTARSAWSTLNDEDTVIRSSALTICANAALAAAAAEGHLMRRFADAMGVSVRRAHDFAPIGFSSDPLASATAAAVVLAQTGMGTPMAPFLKTWWTRPTPNALARALDAARALESPIAKTLARTVDVVITEEGKATMPQDISGDELVDALKGHNDMSDIIILAREAADLGVNPLAYMRTRAVIHALDRDDWESARRCLFVELL